MIWNCPPQLNQQRTICNFFDLLSNQLQDLTNKNKSIYLVGDLNLDLLKYNTVNQVREYVDLLFSFGFIHTISKPTRISEHSATLIDHICTNRLCSDIESTILVTDISDHFPVFHFLHGKKVTENPKFIFTKDFSETNIERFRTALQSINWNAISECNNTQMAYNLFEENFNFLYKLYFPDIKTKFNKNIHKLENWMSKGLLISRTEKIWLYKYSLVHPNPVTKSAFKKYRNIYNYLIRAAKKNTTKNSSLNSKQILRNHGLFYTLLLTKPQKTENKFIPSLSIKVKFLTLS